MRIEQKFNRTNLLLTEEEALAMIANLATALRPIGVRHFSAGCAFDNGEFDAPGVLTIAVEARNATVR